jgi:hypothetical protein
MDEVLVGAGESLGAEVWSGVAEIGAAAAAEDGAWRTDPATLGALVDEVERHAAGDERRGVWLQALGPSPVPVR